MVPNEGLELPRYCHRPSARKDFGTGVRVSLPPTRRFSVSCTLSEFIKYAIALTIVAE